MGDHSVDTEFQLDPSDIFIGKKGASGAATTQFMGEIHEMAFYKEQRRNFRDISSVTPPYRTGLLYYDFEEATL